MLKYIISLILILTASCSTAIDTGVVQRAELSYLKFIGDTNNVYIKIDDSELISLSDFDKNSLFRVDKGKHFLKVYRDNELIINRVIFIEDHATMEIIIQ